MIVQDRPAWAAAIRDLRRRNSLSQEAFAEAIQVDRTTAGAWERGLHRPQPQQIQRICSIFAVSPESLRLVESEAEDEVKRREFSKGLVGLGVMAAAGEPWERLMHAMRPGGQPDVRAIGHLEQVTISLSRLEREVEAPATLLGGVLGHLDTITGFLGGALPSSARRELCSLAAETAALAGWLTWDLDDRVRADAYFRTGLEAAREAGDAALGAYLVGSRASQPFYRENPAERLRNLSGRTYGFAATDASSHTRAWWVTLEAGAHALRGDHGQFARAVDEAEGLLTLDEPVDARRPRVSFFDWPYFAEEKAAGLLRLGRAREARELLASSLGESAGRMRLWILADLAEACAAQGEPEEAARYAMESLDGAAGARVEPILQTLRGLPDGVLAGSRSVPAVQEFADRVRLA